jgi:hypothetical protein
MTKYKGLYRNESPRLRGWDYSKSGYSITLSTQPHRGAIIPENLTKHAIQPRRGGILIQSITHLGTPAPAGRHPNTINHAFVHPSPIGAAS